MALSLIVRRDLPSGSSTTVFVWGGDSISHRILPRIPGASFILLDSVAMAARAEREGKFRALILSSHFWTDSATVSVGTHWVKPQRDVVLEDGDQECTWTFARRRGRWHLVKDYGCIVTG
jgi:hypothetical protein